MQKLRKEADGDFTENYVQLTDYKTAFNQFEVNCGRCNTVLYADRETFGAIERAIEQGIDNPILCNDCREEFEEAAYTAR
jgi:hypothetical protein